MYNFYDWTHYECELLSTYEQIYRKTKNYLYTIETIKYRLYFYRINWTPGPFERFNQAYDCTCYTTYEDAEKEAKMDRRGRGWFITKEYYDTTYRLDHRHKRG